MKPQRVCLYTLGCSKNLVDSERVLKRLEDAGFEAVHEPSSTLRGDIVIINTCGFIGDAKEESVNTILDFAAMRTDGRVSCLYVMGCLSQRYREELAAEIPEVDRWYGKTDWDTIVSDLSARNALQTPVFDRKLTTPPHHAYLKISEGCNRFCAFCAIPLITGRHRSRQVGEIEQEVKMLIGRGVREFNVIAQDLSAYGTDLEGSHSRLAELISRLSDIKGVDWIRLHYAYPADFPMDVLDVMAQRPNVCNYLDIALQHISDPMLKAMRRHITRSQTIELLDEIRRRVPGIHLRTTLMTGFPGETEEHFEELMEFVAQQRFERMGAFAYCEEEGTYSALNYTDNVDPEVKQRRLDRLMSLQERISQEIQNEKVGKDLRVMIDREEAEYFVGRTEWDSPEVDPEVLVEKHPSLRQGEFSMVKITEALPHELMAKVI